MALQLAQLFNVDGGYSPSKASIYLRPVKRKTNLSSSSSSSNGFNIYPNVSIDALNFISITTGGNKIIADDVDGSVGNGAMSCVEINASYDYSQLNYPIYGMTGTYKVWVKVRSETTAISCDVYLDDTYIGNINSVVVAEDWTWLNTEIAISDSDDHILSISLTTDKGAINRIYITSDLSGTVSADPELSESQYITVHTRLYLADGSNNILTGLYVYDYKTTTDEIITDGWYNFDLSFIDDSLVAAYSDIMALVVFSAGTDENQFVVWDAGSSDQLPSAIKIKE